MVRDHDSAADLDMSYQQPIFDSGLFGKANRFVVNGWTDAAVAVSEHAEGLRWAQEQVRRATVQTRFLAKITAATVLATNRWTYDGGGLEITSGRAPAAAGGTFGTFTGAINLRELRNTGSTVDGSPILAGTSIGPVGSSYSGTAWSTTALEGYVEITAAYDSSGGLLYWFDCPNPSRCS